jgi:hypothetical protein
MVAIADVSLHLPGLGDNLADICKTAFNNFFNMDE